MKTTFFITYAADSALLRLLKSHQYSSEQAMGDKHQSVRYSFYYLFLNFVLVMMTVAQIVQYQMVFQSTLNICKIRYYLSWLSMPQFH